MKHLSHESKSHYGIIVTFQAKPRIVCTFDFGHSMNFEICQEGAEGHNDIKFAEMIE